ncbi:MAG: PhoPQ-activated protein PqaA family protein, partial [Candidatus Hydrogenedens sp.]
ILALLDDGSIVPLLGEKRENYAFAKITGLPYQATYVVGFFPTASIIDVPVTVPEDAKLIYPWNLKWRIFGSMPVIKQLVALEKGNMDNPNSFYNENFSESVISDSLKKLASKIAGVYIEYIASGMRNPILVDHEGAYGVIFFNMNSRYTSEYENFDQLAIANRKFGNIVIDPKQLLMVSIHNALTALNETTNMDIKQKLTPYNIFAQYLFYSCFDNYQFPNLTIPDPSNIDIYGKPQMVSYFKGIRESIAIYLGQRADRVVEEIEAKSTKADTARTWARSFEKNEYLDLSQALFQPVSMKTKNYYKAGHEFWVYLERKLTDVPIIALIGASGDPYGGFLQELEKVFKENIKPQQIVNYELATTLTYATLDAVIHAATDEKERLSDLYWYYVRGKSAEKFEETVLRDSDSKDKPFVFNEERFVFVGVPARESPAPTDKVTINPSTIPELSSVLPFSSRAVKVNINPLADTAQVVFNPTEWSADDNGYSLKFAVYHPLRKKVFTLDQDGVDTNGDGVLDTINIQRFIPTEDECFDYVYLLVSNVSLNTVSPINVAIQTKAPSSVPENQILKKFVQICDPYYDYELLRTASFPAFGISSYMLEMTSGMWRGSQELYNAQPWKHYLTIIEPSIVLHDKAILLITGGSTGSEPDITDQAELVLPFVSATGTIAVILKAVPNQPLQFIDDTKKRVEDGIIAYSYDKYMDGYKAREADITWPVLLPMVRSAVRAMDTVQKFVKEEKPGRRYEINKFVVTGASKRGWTTWLTSAVDPRVYSAMPIVIDVLNMPYQIEHHYYSYGEKFSPALIDYVSFGIFDRLGTPEGNSLWKIVDPINYVDSLTMPKFILNSTGDQFFLPDSAKFYFNMLKPNITLTNGVVYPDNAYLYYAPNTDHGLTSSNALDLDENSYRALLAFYLSVINNRERPKFVWWVEQDTAEININKRAFRIRLDAITKPKEVLLWQATNKNGRDFRLSTIGLEWSSSKLKPFCEECGGDPGFDPEKIIDTSTTNEKSYYANSDIMDTAKSILGNIRNSDNQKVLCLEGTPYQMGYQYGSLLKDEINQFIHSENFSVHQSGEEELAIQLKKDMPPMWNEITQGIADGSAIPYEQLLKAHIAWWKSQPIDNRIYQTSIVSINNTQDNPTLLLTLWKPNNQKAFITIDPIGLFTMNIVIKETGDAIAIVNNTSEPLINNIRKIQFTLDWLNTSIPITGIELNTSDFDVLYANKDAFYAIDLDGTKIKTISIASSTILEDKNWIYRYTPPNQTISFPSKDNYSNSISLTSLIDT